MKIYEVLKKTRTIWSALKRSFFFLSKGLSVTNIASRENAANLLKYHVTRKNQICKPASLQQEKYAQLFLSCKCCVKIWQLFIPRCSLLPFSDCTHAITQLLRLAFVNIHIFYGCQNKKSVMKAYFPTIGSFSARISYFSTSVLLL